jgi:hypothetical protein
MLATFFSIWGYFVPSSFREYVFCLMTAGCKVCALLTQGSATLCSANKCEHQDYEKAKQARWPNSVV